MAPVSNVTDDDADQVRDLRVTATPEFQALKSELAQAIYDAHR